MEKFNISFPIHPFLFAVFPVLFFVSHNKGQISPTSDDVVVSILIVIFLAVVSWLLISRILKDKVKSGLLVSLSLLLFFSYGHVHDFIGDFNYVVGNFNIGKDKVLFLFWPALFLLGTYFLIKTCRNLNTLSNFLNFIAAALVIVSFANILSFELNLRRAVSGGEIKNNGSEEMRLKKPAKPPDIYYIIFDAYPSSSTLKKIYKYDNSELTDSLTKKGFYVASKSLSNYAHTHFSLPSSLNMKYINYLADDLGKTSRDTSVPKAMIEDNKVVHSLKSLGYKFIQIGFEYSPTSHNKYADINVMADEPSIKIAGISYRLNEYSTTFLQTTILSPLIKQFIDDDRKAQRLNALRKVSEVVYIHGPKFVFAHLTISHPPPLFDADGNTVPKSKLEKIGDAYSDQENNLEQLIFVGKKMAEMAENIISKSESSPIIIFQADHGPTSLLGHPHHWKRPFEKNMLGVKERMSILNVYYLPNGGDELLYDSISPVNTFRLIFNRYFGATYELLPDKSYYSDHINPYEFFDVAEKVE